VHTGIGRNVGTLIITRNIVGCCNSNGILVSSSSFS
jgi:hypothetical protein